MKENTEIVYVCNSINNKNVRANELKILEKHEEELYFTFGENNINSKKRYYKDLKTLNKDFEVLKKIKSEQETEKKIILNNKKTDEDTPIFDKK